MLYLGDCLDVLARLEENSIDSVITDPPYGLGKQPDIFKVLKAWTNDEGVDNGGGFMGKEWDSFVPGPHYWKAVYRVMKPGAIALVFGGTRTYDLTTLALRMAGFEIRDTITWLYGCVDEETEILTLGGWKKYYPEIHNETVLCYDISQGSFVFDKPERAFCYENKHTAYRIHSKHTEQLVSYNHRCIVERNGRNVFRQAQTLECQESVPFLETLHDLPETISNIHQGTSIKKQDLLRTVQNTSGEQGQTKKETQGKAESKKASSCLSGLWQGIFQGKKSRRKGENPYLFKTMCGLLSWLGVCQVCTLGTCKLDRRIRTSIQRKNVRVKQSFLERWCNLFQEKGQLHRRCICSLSRKLFGNGTQGWLYNATSVGNGTISWQAFNTERGCPSYKPRSFRQQNRKPNVVSKQCKTQALRRTRTTVTPVEYSGKMWCVQVSTGAFVARRKGMIFVTGNSGFPKSHDISKAIDKKAGKKRKVVGFRNPEGSICVAAPDVTGSHIWTGKLTSKEAITPEAELWNGYGTALKPAWEPIIVAMKPVEGTFAENALTHGVAGFWIDGCRIGVDTIDVPQLKTTDDMCRPGQNQEWTGEIKQHQGRFPANLILSHTPECKRVGIKKVRAENRTRPPRTPNTIYGGGKGTNLTSFECPMPEDGLEEIESWECSENCPVAMLDRQSGIRPSGGIDGIRIGGPNNCMSGANYPRVYQGGRKADTGGASRFFYCAKASTKERNQGLEERNIHPTVKPLELMRYLCRLTKTPTGGIVLDPFMGSGTTGIAAILEDRDFIGIELTPEYFEIAEQRIKHARGDQLALNI